MANAPCSWGALEFHTPSEAPAGERILAEMAAAGYVGTELGDWGLLPTEPAPLAELLDRHGLQLVGAFVPVALPDPAAHAEGLTRALRTATLLAAVSPTARLVLADDNGRVPQRVQHAGRIRPEHGLDSAQWAVLARGAQHIAHAVAEQAGVRTVFHHHCGGYVETPAEVAELLRRTDPDLLGLCLDTGHWTFAGGDAAVALAHFGDRIEHLHAKDCDPVLAARARERGWDYFESVGHGVFCELGRGCVDLAALVSFADGVTDRAPARTPGWIVVEQDVLPGMGTPWQSARRNREALRAAGA